MNKENVGLYDQSFEHDNCGIGAVVNIKGLKTYKTVDDALKIVEQLEHRAGKDAAGETGDGVGILTQIPDEYFQKVIKDFTLPQKGHYGVGMFFMPQDEKVRLRVKKMFETVVKKEGLEFLGWRAVPTVPCVLGKKALDAMPYIVQAFIKKLRLITVSIEDISRNEINVIAEHIRNHICPNIHAYLPVLKSINVPESSSLGWSEIKIRYVSALRGRKYALFISETKGSTELSGVAK